MRIKKQNTALKYGLVAGIVAGVSVGLMSGVVAPVVAADVQTQKARSYRPADAIDEQLAVTTPPVGSMAAIPAEELFTTGANAYFEGDFGSALKRFEQAAEDGHPLAQWKLGRMYQEGDGVGANPAMAFKYFTDVAITHGEEPPNTSMAPFVAYALVAVGEYYLGGIEESGIRENPRKAMKIFRYAASFYGSADAQYNLGLMYFEGSVGPEDKKMAARWLKLAALKGQHKAQALLGRMMFRGDGIPARLSEGLMWLTLARERAEGQEDDWIRDVQERAFALASESQRRSAINGAGKWNNTFSGQ